MKRIRIIVVVAVTMLLSACGGRYSKVDSLPNARVFVTLTGQEKDVTVIASEILEDAPDIVEGIDEEVQIDIRCTQSRIISVMQDGYFDDEGWFLNEDVFYALKSLPSNNCSYQTNIPNDHTYTVEIELENGETHYFKFTKSE